MSSTALLHLLEPRYYYLLTFLSDGITSHEEVMLQAMVSDLTYYYNSKPPESVVLTDDGLFTIWELSKERERLQGELPQLSILMSRALDAKAPIVQQIGNVSDGLSSMVFMAAPILDEAGVAKGALALAMTPTLSSFIRGVLLEEQNQEYEIELVTEDRTVVAASDKEHLFQTSRHLPIISWMISDGQEGVQEHKISDARLDGDSGDHILAFAPLENLPWGIVLEQKEDVALALPRSLQRRILLLSGLAVFLGLLLAWITTRQVVRPLVRLTATSRHIASGDLSTQVPIEGQDEVRTLASSFEAMRGQLKTSLEEIEEWNRTSRDQGAGQN